MTALSVRSGFLHVLRDDLVGPDPDDPRDAAHATETLSAAPSHWYLTGFLAPTGQNAEDKEDDEAGSDLGSAVDDPSDGEAEAPVARRPVFERQAETDLSRWPTRADTAAGLLAAARTARDRIQRGIDLLATDGAAREAFEIAHQAMAAAQIQREKQGDQVEVYVNLPSKTDTDEDEAAQERNLEAGVLLDHPRLSASLVGRFRALRDAGRLRRMVRPRCHPDGGLRNLPPTMAILERKGTRVRRHLLARHLVGRSGLAQLRIADPSVSAEHAVLGWNGRTWEVHDLGSRNGTTVDGRRLAQGERAELKRGATLDFGSQGSVWCLVDDAPPAVMALPEGGGDPVVGEHDLLALPGPDDPEVTVYRDASDWRLDRDGALLPVTDRSEVTAGGRRFTLHLPDVVAQTLEAAGAPLALDAITLAFRVSRDEEYIALTAHSGERSVDLGARAHHALLLALARARLRDSEPSLPESSRGWVYQEDLARGLGLDEPHLNVTIFRCRQHIGAAGIAGAPGIVERRKPARQLRLGVATIEIDIV